jgi:hypothetical protein
LDSVVGQYFADLLVEDSILLELKATEFLSRPTITVCPLPPRHRPQSLPALNFGRPRLEVQRIVNRF